MNYLTTEELEAIQNEILYFLPDQCYVLRKTNTIDASGNVIETQGTAGPYYCRFVTLEKLEGIFGGQGFERELTKEWYKVYFPVGTTVEGGDILRKGTNEFSVVRAFGEQTNPMVKQVMAVDITGDIR